MRLVLRSGCGEGTVLARIEDRLHALPASLDDAPVLVEIHDDAVAGDLVRAVVQNRCFGEDQRPVALLEDGPAAGRPPGAVVDPHVSHRDDLLETLVSLA